MNLDSSNMSDELTSFVKFKFFEKNDFFGKISIGN